MQPYSRDNDQPTPADEAPTTHNNKLRPMLPVELTTVLRVAKMQLPMTLKMMRIGTGPSKCTIFYGSMLPRRIDGAEVGDSGPQWPS
jgi:hypothetical protein